MTCISCGKNDLYSLLLHHAERTPEKTALIDQDIRVTYAQLLRRINALAAGMAAGGITAGSRVGLILPNCPQFLTVMYACHKLGAVVAPFNVRNRLEEFAQQISDAECEWIFYDRTKREMLAPLIDAASGKRRYLSVNTDCTGGDDYSDIPLREKENDCHVPLFAPDTPMLYLFTGGTTGSSKLAVHTKESLTQWVLMKSGVPRHFEADDVFLQSPPMFHSAGIGMAHDLLSSGATMVLMRHFQPEDFLLNVQRYGVTQIFLIPPTLIYLLRDQQNRQARQLDSVKMVSLSGGASDPKQIQTAFSLFPNARVCLVYASSERWAFLLHTLSRRQCQEHPEWMLSVGKPYLGTELRLVDEAGQEVPAGQPGLALVHSSVQMAGYHGRRPLEKGGWFDTGDMMKRDADGNYYFLSRKKDCIKTGGENVYAVEVERVLGTFPGVIDCAVVGLPDERYSEMVSAAVTADRTLSGEEIIAFCKAHLASYKKPRSIYFFDALPKTLVGKTDKQALKERMLAREPDFRLESIS